MKFVEGLIADGTWEHRFKFYAMIAAATIYNVTLIVWPGEIAVLIHRGRGVRCDRTLSAGVYPHVPYIERVERFAIEPEPQIGTMKVRSADDQEFEVAIRITYHPNPQRVGVIYDDYGTNYTAKMFPTLFLQAMLEIATVSNAKQLSTSFESGQLQQRLQDRLTELLRKHFVEVELVEVLKVAPVAAAVVNRPSQQELVGL